MIESMKLKWKIDAAVHISICYCCTNPELQLFEDLAEIPRAGLLLLRQPLRCAHSAQGKPAPARCIVSKLDHIEVGLRRNHMLPTGIPFTVRCNGNFNAGVSRRKNFFERNRCTGGRIKLRRMVRLADRKRAVVELCQLLSRPEELLYANRKIGS